jgi:hypothetical protein
VFRLQLHLSSCAFLPPSQILKCLRVDQRLGQITNVISIMIPQLVASGTTFGAIFLFMTYIAYIFFGTNLEDWSTFIFSIGSSIGAFFRAQAQFFLSFSLLLDNNAVVKMNIYFVVRSETKRVCEVLGLVISF